jgi:N-acyl-D-amino-acid deacylase
MTIEKVCRKLAGDAAEFFALENLGKIAPGYAADITVFSPENIDSAADFSDPCRIPQGITCVFKGGRSNHF